MARKKKYKGHENPALHASVIGRALSSAAGAHKDRRDKRARTRADKLRRALRDD